MTELYVGTVHHARFGRRRHRLRYRIFMALADLGEAPAGRGVWGRNRPGLISVWDRDHGDGSAGTLRDQIERLIAAQGLPRPTGVIRMLSMPRVLGRAFNPLTVYYAHDAEGRLQTVVYEVNNTFGARHFYVLLAHEADGRARHRCGKDFFVSPFMDQDLAYDFDLGAPAERVFIGIRVSRGAETVLTASFEGRRRPLTAVNLLVVWLSHPLQTVGVLAGIYFEALKLFLKGFRWRSPASVPTTEAGSATV